MSDLTPTATETRSLVLLSRLAARWIRDQQRRHMTTARPLTQPEMDAMSGFFEPELLAAVRIGVVERIDGPWFLKPMEKLGFSLDMSFGSAAGITFGDLILVSKLGRVDPLPRPLLFHELVHVVQYRAHGVDGFARGYVQGWWDNDRVYRAIPHEVEAYDYEDRYRRGERFTVCCELPKPG